MKLEEQRSRALPEQATSQKEDSGGIDEDSLASLGSPAISAEAFACMSQGRLPAGKKPHVIQNVTGEEEAQEESGSLPTYSEEEEETILRKRVPKKNLLQGRSARTGKVHIGNSQDRNEQLKQNKKKAFRRHRHSRRQQVTEKPGDKSETVFCSHVEGQPSKPYSFRSRSKVVSYVSQQEEEAEKSWSEGSSVEDWLPEEEGSDVEEEEDPDEMEVEEDKETEREEELEAGARQGQAEPQKKNPPKTVRSYQCPECSRKFNNSSNMRKHLRIHRGERLYGCHACGKSYTDPSNLAHHQRMHTGERPHVCPTCPKAFSVKVNLDTHIREHLGIRPFACLQCSGTFCSQARLICHMKGHDRRPTWVRCEDCDKTFSSRRLLYEHRRRHRNLVCEDCGEVFAFKYKYKFHRSLHKTCVPCGVRYIGMHLCNERVQQPQPASRKSPASVPHGAVAGHAGGLKQPVSSAQAAAESAGAERPSVSVSTLLPTDGQVRLSNPAHATCVKEISRVAQKSISASQQTKSLASVSLPVLENRGAKPSTLSQKPLQLKPPGVLLQNGPSAQPVTSSPTVAKAFAQIPALLCPAEPVTNLPHTQVLAAFSISSVASSTIILLTDSHNRLLTVTAPLGPMQPSSSNPVTGAANNGKIPMNAGTLPLDPKIPSETIAPSMTAQICAPCPTEYVEKHQCTKSPQDPKDPCHELVPRLSLKEPRNELDEQLEEVEREIKAIVEFWEQCFVDGKEDTNLESPWISKWHLGHPLDLNDEGLREDPLYDEGEVEQAALHDYMTMLEEQRTHPLPEQATSQKEDSAASSSVDEESLASLGSPAIPAEAFACMSQGRLPTGKKPHVIQNVAGEEEAQEESGSLPTYSEEEEETILRKRVPSKNLLPGRSTRTGKVHIGNSQDRNEQLTSKKKVSGHYHHNHQQQVTEQSGDRSETVFSSRVGGQPSKPYSFRSRSKVVSYVSQQEEEAEKSWSEGSSGEDWLPEEEGSDVEEEDEMEVEKDKETEREEELEAGARRGRAEASVSLPVLENRGDKPSTLSQKPLQLKPPGVLLQNGPSAQPVTSSPTVAKAFAQIPALLWPAKPATNLPHTQALGASSISSAAPPTIYLLTDSHNRLLTVSAPLEQMQPSGSNPVTGAADNDLIPMNPATLPSDPKIPSEEIAPSMTAQICATCLTEYVEKHQCTKSPQDPNPCPESIPRHALKEHENKLDKQLEEVEREIRAIIEFWEHSFADDKENTSSKSPWIIFPTEETDLELQSNPIKVISEFVNKFLKEQAAVLHIGRTRVVVDPELTSAYQPLPSASKAPNVSVEVKQPDYVKEPEGQRARVLSEQAAHQKQDSATLHGVLDSKGRLMPPAEALASPPQGRWAIRKKPFATRKIAGTAEATREKVQVGLGSPPISNKEGKAAILLKKTAKWNFLQSQAAGMEKMHVGNPTDRNECQKQGKSKVSMQAKALTTTGNQ